MPGRATAIVHSGSGARVLVLECVDREHPAASVSRGDPPPTSRRGVGDRGVGGVLIGAGIEAGNEAFEFRPRDPAGPRDMNRVYLATLDQAVDRCPADAEHLRGLDGREQQLLVGEVAVSDHVWASRSVTGLAGRSSLAERWAQRRRTAARATAPALSVGARGPTLRARR